MRWLRRLKALWHHSDYMERTLRQNERFKHRFEAVDDSALAKLKEELFDKLMSYDEVDRSDTAEVMRTAWYETIKEMKRRAERKQTPADLAAAEEFIADRCSAALEASKRPKRPALKIIK